MTFGPDLAERRQRELVQQKDIAARIGVSRMTVHIWERSADLDAEKAERYVRALEAIMAERNEEAVS